MSRRKPMFSRKPMFIVVTREIFEKKFRHATDEVEEFRVLGPRWNPESARIGRRVTVSAGYGKHHRITGVITGFRAQANAMKNCPDWNLVYASDGIAACIKIKPDTRA